ncbi:hypothetical protein AMS68_005991 [Peltaster fructicola]|uniref:RING-type domain-containing protein n=1 Tax=Peltaster fructicola TaxID=286661 RepID=A0A6H0Y0E2_9PEZI|nr:hypothetical protein AMS68_005991 [Peltaster fructicola]
MGTLTAGQPRLAGYCAHKLPTSCRLSSIPECCACADERAHAAAYSIYIDGVGYVSRGSRWQRYCWFCKEFWENRIRASGLTPAQTRIPDNPDQTAFLDRWYEFHQGYRIVTKEDGSEERIAVLGEDLRDVSPGCMPRTLQEVREDREMSAFDDQGVSARSAMAVTTAVGPSLDEELDRMFEDASAEQAPEPPTQDNALNSMMAARGHLIRNNEYQNRRIVALRRELQRLRNGIERVITGLRELGEPVPDHRDATGRLAMLSRTLDDMTQPSTNTSDPALGAGSTTASMQTRVDQAREVADEARRTRDQAAAELESADQEMRSSQTRLQQLQREQRTTENYVRIFGTREDIIAQGDAYESPIGGMFTRAWERFRAAEDLRQEERTLRQYLEGEHASGGEEQMRRLVELENLDRDVWGVPQSQASSGNDPSVGIRHQGTSNTTQLMEMARDEVFAGQLSQSQASTADERSLEHRQDRSDSRPDPISLAASLTLVELPYELDEANLRRDAEFLLLRISDGDVTSPFIREVGLSTDRASDLLTDYLAPNPREAAVDMVDSLLADDETIWAAGLPSEWFRRERITRCRLLSMTANPTSDGREEQRQNIEAMAQAFMMSSSVRRCSTLDESEQLHTLSRMQRELRTQDDRRMLWMMLNINHAVETARHVLRQQVAFQPTPDIADRLAALAAQRRRMANNNDASREALNRSRQAVTAFVETHARGVSAVQHEMFDSDSSDDEDALGLDAMDTGRPEPKEDDEMTMKLECRICYSQVAEVACLPCGHLVMCRWCSDQHSPTMRHDKTRPRLPASCPVCRKGIKQKLRVYRA